MATGSATMSSNKIWRTKLCSWGTSQAVRIPKEICEEVGLVSGDELDMATYRDSDGVHVLIRNARKAHRSFTAAPRISLRNLLHNYQGDYHGEELDWGKDVGAEVIQ